MSQDQSPLDLKELPFAATLPLQIQHKFSHAQPLYSALEVRAAADRLAVHLTVDWQDQNPLCVVMLPGGLLFAGMLMQRMVFPLQLQTLAQDKIGEAVVETMAGRPVLFIDGVFDRELYASVKAKWMAAGAKDVRSVTLLDPNTEPGADYAALRCPAKHFLGSGLSLQGYGANFPGVYTID